MIPKHARNYKVLDTYSFFDRATNHYFHIVKKRYDGDLLPRYRATVWYSNHTFIAGKDCFSFARAIRYARSVIEASKGGAA
jgi:hypothetical protein